MSRLQHDHFIPGVIHPPRFRGKATNRAMRFDHIAGVRLDFPNGCPRLLVVETTAHDPIRHQAVLMMAKLQETDKVAWRTHIHGI